MRFRVYSSVTGCMSQTDDQTGDRLELVMRGEVQKLKESDLRDFLQPPEDNMSSVMYSSFCVVPGKRRRVVEMQNYMYKRKKVCVKSHTNSLRPNRVNHSLVPLFLLPVWNNHSSQDQSVLDLYLYDLLPFCLITPSKIPFFNCLRWRMFLLLLQFAQSSQLWANRSSGDLFSPPRLSKTQHLWLCLSCWRSGVTVWEFKLQALRVPVIYSTGPNRRTLCPQPQACGLHKDLLIKDL